jgi:glycerate kinase
MERLEAAMLHYAQVVDAWCGRDASAMPGAGAAGGVGYAMSALLGVELRSGIDMVLDVVDFDDAVVGADLVVTGEGRVDRQTLMGKAPAGVARRAQRLGVPCVAVGGSVAWADIPVETPFAYIDAATPASMPLDEAMRHPIAISNLRAAGSRVARWWLENRE